MSHRPFRGALGAALLLAAGCSDITGVVRRPADAQLLVYLTGTREAPGGLFRMDADGGNREQVPVPEGGVRALTWSPDHRRVALSTGGVDRGSLRVMDADGTGAITVDLSEPDGDYLLGRIAWSPDGARVAFGICRSAGCRIRSVRPDGTGLQTLVDEGGSPTGMTWSPDGRFFAYAVNAPPGDHGNRAIAVRRADGSGRRLILLPTHLWNAGSPTWSPDGREIAFSHVGGLGLVHRDGSNARWTLDAGGFSVYHPAWSPDGERIAYVRGPNPEVWITSREGIAPVGRVLGTERAATLAW